MIRARSSADSAATRAWAVIIGRRTRDVSADDALGSVFGYTCLNDVSARDLQVSDGQWVRAKSLDTCCPPRQEATTADMVHGVLELIAFCSRSFTLEPGDVVAVSIDGIGTLANRCRVVPA